MLKILTHKYPNNLKSTVSYLTFSLPLNNYKVSKFINFHKKYLMESDPNSNSAKKGSEEKIENIDLEVTNLKRKADKSNVESSTEKKKSAKKKVINFVTGNANKFKEAADILKAQIPDVEIKQVSVDIPELQGDPEEIVRAKLKLALEKTKGPIVVDDTSLCFNALNGLPGAYIKSFLEKLGREGLFNMIKNYEDHTAYAQCIFGLTKKKTEEPKIFIGRTEGSIVMPKGDNNFGWDPVFLPKGFDQTYAELDKTVKNQISHRYKALIEVANWLKENPDYL